MKIINNINFEELNDDVAKAALSLQETKCERLLEELKICLDKENIKKLNNLYDELHLFNELANTIFFKLGYKKAAKIFLDGSI